MSWLRFLPLLLEFTIYEVEHFWRSETHCIVPLAHSVVTFDGALHVWTNFADQVTQVTTSCSGISRPSRTVIFMVANWSIDAASVGAARMDLVSNPFAGAV